jgi:sensor histidine kinase regulating citrate/malate metabolism
MSVINAELSIFKSIPLNTIALISILSLIMGVIAVGVLIINLFELTKKEIQYQSQAVYIETVDELYSAIRCERHDIINHLQVIYGFTKMGCLEEVQDYLAELLGGNILSNELVITGSPGLTALFFIKSGIAKGNKIQFHVTVDKRIEKMKLSPYEINNILGNLINNAFDAVMSLEINQRIVNVSMGEKEHYYIFKVANYGSLSTDAARKIFEKGYSTKKDGHAGLGLYIVQGLVKKYGGRMEVNNLEDNMLEFSIFLPISSEKEVLHEFTSQKNGSFVS